MTPINQQREVSKCCGAETREESDIAPVCKKYEKKCNLKPQDHIVQVDKMVAKTCGVISAEHLCGRDCAPAEPTENETRSTGNMIITWQERFNALFTFKYPENIGTYEQQLVFDMQRISPSKIKHFIRDLLAAQRAEMERGFDSVKKEAREGIQQMIDEANSATLKIKDLESLHNKQIIEAVDEALEKVYEECIRRAHPSRIPGGDREVALPHVARSCTKISAEFKRENGGKE